MHSAAAPVKNAPPESAWVEAELVRSLMRTMRITQPLGIGVIFIFFAVVIDHSHWGWVAAWTLLAGGSAAWRAWVLRRFALSVSRGADADALAFFMRWRTAFVLPALGWGLTIPLFFDRAPLAEQFVCWLVLTGLGMFSISSLAAHLQTFRAYLDTLALTALLLIGWHVGVRQAFAGPTYLYWVALLLTLMWVGLREAGRRQHAMLRRNFELQFRNNQLIDSLRQQTQAALEAVDTKNRFLASAAHDMRQPVHALGLYADWLGNEPEMVHEIAPRIVESTKAVNALFDSLFDLSRLDAGQVRLAVGPVDLASLLRDLELQYRPLALARGLQFRVRMRPGSTVSDLLMLRRIAGNLVSNAIKYTRTGGVLLCVRMRQGRHVLEVWDTGVGIAPAYEREVFREFFKIASHPGTDDGFGLGLHIVARLSRILGHPVSMASRVGRGSVFRVDLAPTDPEAAQQRSQAAVAQLASIPWVRA